MNSFGRIFRVSIFGESHGPSVGISIDGCPAGLPLTEDDFTTDIERRKGGMQKGTTPRKEDDNPIFLTGVFNGKTTGAPLTILFENKNTRSGDYEKQRAIPRPGHADLVAHQKFGGFEDFRGGGHFSGRLTVCLVGAGVVAKKILQHIRPVAPPPPKGGEADTQAQPVGETAFHATIPTKQFVGAEKTKANIFGEATPDTISSQSEAGAVAFPPLGGGGAVVSTILEIAGLTNLEAGLQKAIDQKDSVGGIIECRVTGLPPGLGEPFFDSIESLLAHAVFAIPAVKGIEFGTGFAAARMFGVEHNDSIIDAAGTTATNHAGGVVGGITNGNELVFRVAIKPTSSTPKEQQTWNWESGQMDTFSVKGRHDLCIALRVPPVLEAVTAMVLADLFLLEQRVNRVL